MTKYKEIFKFKYPKPKNYQKNSDEFKHFHALEDIDYYDAIIQDLRNVKIANNSVIYEYFKIYRDSCIHETNYKKYGQGYKFYLKYLFPQFILSKEKFVTITDEWTSNYYHWHNFALKKLVVLLENNLLDDSYLLLPEKYKTYSFVLPSLEKFGIKTNQIKYLRKKSHINVKETPLINISRQHPRLFKKVREHLITNVKQFDLNFGDKIYVSRQQQKLRFIENHQDFYAILQKYGFQEVIAENYSYEEQVYIFSNAKYLVGPHGAGITNLIYLQPKGSVLEIATSRESFNDDFYSLAAMTGINYYYQECPTGPNSHENRRDFHHGSLVVNLEVLEKNIQLMLATPV